MSKTQALKDSTILFVFLFLFWGCYRLIFKLPDEVEEFVIKPVVWIVPVLYFVHKEKQTLQSIGLTFNNLFKAVYFALILGSLFVAIAVIANFLKYGQFNFGANLGAQPLLLSLVLSFATAISEEIVFRGFLFTRLWQALGNEWHANLITSTGWMIIHIPITIFVNKLDPASAIIYLTLTFIYGVGAAYVFARTKNIFSSIFLHVLWEWPIMLFR
jgi:CAAX protease family protein